jgi:hypothetical protein
MLINYQCAVPPLPVVHFQHQGCVSLETLCCTIIEADVKQCAYDAIEDFDGMLWGTISFYFYLNYYFSIVPV